MNSDKIQSYPLLYQNQGRLLQKIIQSNLLETDYCCNISLHYCRHLPACGRVSQPFQQKASCFRQTGPGINFLSFTLVSPFRMRSYTRRKAEVHGKLAMGVSEHGWALDRNFRSKFMGSLSQGRREDMFGYEVTFGSCTSSKRWVCPLARWKDCYVQSRIRISVFVWRVADHLFSINRSHFALTAR